MSTGKLLISAAVESGFKQHRVTLTTAGNSHSLEVAPRSSGFGSSANGGELLCLALATCYCNDLYREAAKHRESAHTTREARLTRRLSRP